MSDIALVWDNMNGRADFAIVNGDLLMDNGLNTALIISIFCDRQAAPGDVIPDGGSDPRGWWGDSAGAGIPGMLTGSGLWLEIPGLQTDAKLLALQNRVLTATAWMTSGTPAVADKVTCTATYPALGAVNISVSVYQDSNVSTYDYFWKNT